MSAFGKHQLTINYYTDVQCTTTVWNQNLRNVKFFSDGFGFTTLGYINSAAWPVSNVVQQKFIFSIEKYYSKRNMNLTTILCTLFLSWSASAAPTTLSNFNIDSTATNSYEVVTQEPDATLSEFTFGQDDVTNFEENTTAAMDEELVTFATPLDETSQLMEEEVVQATTSRFVENSNSERTSSFLSTLFSTEWAGSDDVTTFGTDYVTTNTESTATSDTEVTEYEDSWVDEEEQSTQQTTETATTTSTASASFKKPQKVAKARQSPSLMYSGSSSFSWSSSTSFSMADFKKKMSEVLNTAKSIFAQYVSLFRILYLHVQWMPTLIYF